MQIAADRMRAGYLVPACSSPTGEAAPARRIVELTQQLGGTVQSICQSDFGPAISALARQFERAIGGACLPRPLNPDAEGLVPCDVLEVVPPGEHCATLDVAEAYSFAGIEADPSDPSVTREVCRVRQVGRAGAGTEAGWVYDDGTLGPFSASMPAACTQRIALSVIEPIRGAEQRLQCTQTILPSAGGAVQLGSFCDPETQRVLDSEDLCAIGHATAGNPDTLSCDAFDRACAMRCTSDADCTHAGLLSFVCDTRTASEYFGGAPLPSDVAPSTVHGFCVNATCR
jgi:hypothetical protein